MDRQDFAIIAATADMLPAVHALVERAYRGDAARAGWSNEADLVQGPRTDLAALGALLGSPADRLLVAMAGGVAIGCVQVSDRGGGLASLGLLCIEPGLQAGGFGRRLIAAAEDVAREAFEARRMEMTVIDVRAELIAYYGRRGYVATGERRPFPVVLDPPLAFSVLAKEMTR